MSELPDIKKIHAEIDTIENESVKNENISLSILRLDKIHPGIQGNKFFKLYYFLQQAIAQQTKIITFGGAYSNHLAATATACRIFEIECIGMVRGEEPETLSHTLATCVKNGMQLEFISREDYKRKGDKDFKNKLTDKFGDHILIPQGGYSTEGADGASLISNFYSKQDYSHICCPVGTATTLAGLIKSFSITQRIVGFSALKNLNDHENRIEFLIGKPLIKNYAVTNDYHFGGYAKKNNELISFMNKFYGEYAIPTDFVYTGKMMFGVFDLIKKNYFPAGSKIICIHTGGLQGNLSLPKGTLNFDFP